MTNAIYEFVAAKNKVTVVFEHNSSTSDSNLMTKFRHHASFKWVGLLN